MTKEEYLNEIKKAKEQVKIKELQYFNLTQKYKKDFAFLEGTKVKLSRNNFNTSAGKDEIEEYFLFVRTCYFNPDLLDFQYTFSHITSTGKASGVKCGVYYRPSTDKIEKIC